MIPTRFIITVKWDDEDYDEEEYVKTSVTDTVRKVFEYVYECDKTATDVADMMDCLFERGSYVFPGRECTVTIKMEVFKMEVSE